MMKGMLFDIQRGSMVDGPGIRTTVFFKGCNLHCAWCHNPESQSVQKQRMYFENKCIHCGLCRSVCPSPETCILCGECAGVCPRGAISLCGQESSAEEILDIILRDEIFYGDAGGVTFSGGECMLQIDFLEELLRKCRARGIHTAVDTAGAVPWSYFERILPYTDLLLYDVKCFSSQLHRAWTGVPNELILENLKRLSDANAGIHIRIPVIPGFNDSPEEMGRIGAFLSKIRYKKLEMLPYHKMGEHKFAALGAEVRCFAVPSQDTMQQLQKIIDRHTNGGSP